VFSDLSSLTISLECYRRPPVPQSCGISKPCATPDKPRPVIPISTFGAPTNNTCTTYSLPFSQVSANSNPRCDVLLRLYKAHDNGKTEPSDCALTECLKEMPVLPSQRPFYLIMDVLDECPTTSGIPSDRERILQLVKGLTDLGLPNLHICVTSLPEIDIRHILEPLASLRVFLHDQSGQKKAIVEYVKSVVYSDSEPIMRRWRMEDKSLVIETLAERADGM
jgi:hypothetical protein